MITPALYSHPMVFQSSLKVRVGGWLSTMLSLISFNESTRGADASVCCVKVYCKLLVTCTNELSKFNSCGRFHCKLSKLTE